VRRSGIDMRRAARVPKLMGKIGRLNGKGFPFSPYAAGREDALGSVWVATSSVLPREAGAGDMSDRTTLTSIPMQTSLARWEWETGQAALGPQGLIGYDPAGDSTS